VRGICIFVVAIQQQWCPNPHNQNIFFFLLVHSFFISINVFICDQIYNASLFSLYIHKKSHDFAEIALSLVVEKGPGPHDGRQIVSWMVGHMRKSPFIACECLLFVVFVFFCLFFFPSFFLESYCVPKQQKQNYYICCYYCPRRSRHSQQNVQPLPCKTK
jgi:hypothetical protein